MHQYQHNLVLTSTGRNTRVLSFRTEYSCWLPGGSGRLVGTRARQHQAFNQVACISPAYHQPPLPSLLFYCSHILTILTISLYTLSLGFVNKTVAIMINLTSILRVGWMSRGFRMGCSSRGPKSSLQHRSLMDGSHPL